MSKTKVTGTAGEAYNFTYVVSAPRTDRLIKLDDGDYVGVNHRNLDALIGSLMHLCDLNSDKEYREALKSEIKMRCRDWLNDQYAVAGYND